MSQKGRDSTVIQNKKARFEYEILDTYTAGIQLTGTEVKSLRAGKASLQDAYCLIEDSEIFVKGLNISEYDKGGYTNHDPLRLRKLLLKKREIQKLFKASDTKGYTLVPLKVFFNERNFAKVEVAVARGKKSFDKRDSIKERDVRREMDRQMK
jgi:SsrA-binding protein